MHRQTFHNFVKPRVTHVFGMGLLLMLLVNAVCAQSILIPMDDTQNDHLRAYGLVYWCLQTQRQYHAEWLLNYRSGSFIIEDHAEVRQRANLMGVSFQPVSLAEIDVIYQAIESGNMDTVMLEKAPKIAIYTPGDKEPWDDAVTLALTYADIPYDTIWDTEVLAGRLLEYVSGGSLTTAMIPCGVLVRQMERNWLSVAILRG